MGRLRVWMDFRDITWLQEVLIAFSLCLFGVKREPSGRRHGGEALTLLQSNVFNNLAYFATIYATNLAVAGLHSAAAPGRLAVALNCEDSTRTVIKSALCIQ
jgi:hypothetical protein